MGARFSASVQTGPGAHPASYTMRTGSFPGVKRPRRGVDHPPTSSAEVEGRVELYICSPSGPSWPVRGRTLPLPLLPFMEYKNWKNYLPRRSTSVDYSETCVTDAAKSMRARNNVRHSHFVLVDIYRTVKPIVTWGRHFYRIVKCVCVKCISPSTDGVFLVQP